MANSEINKQEIAKNNKAIFQIEAEVMANKALSYQSRSMIDENRLMILSNYAAAFMGNRQLANSNTDEIFNNRTQILNAMHTESDVQENYVNAQKNKAKLDFLEHRSGLNVSVLAVSEKLAEINAQLIDINAEIMSNNAKIALFNSKQISVNSKLLEGSQSASNATPEINAELIAANSQAMENLSANVSKNKSKIQELLATSAKNNEALLENKRRINKRRESILENREGIEVNKARLA